AGAQANLAERHVDGAVIRNAAADQADKSARRAGDDAGVADSRRSALSGKFQIAGVEIGIGDIEGCGNKAAADLYRTGRRDGNSVGVNQENLSVAADLARDGRGR